MPETRPVWLTREQRNKLSGWAQPDLMRAIAWAWDAAPADATEAVLAVIRETDGLDVYATAVLRALGMPDA